MEIQVEKIKGRRINKTIINFVISEGMITFADKKNVEHGVDFDEIDTLVITDSPVAPALLKACRSLVAYRDTAGPLNFQLEKADDFINLIRAAIEKKGN